MDYRRSSFILLIPLLLAACASPVTPPATTPPTSAPAETSPPTSTPILEPTAIPTTTPTATPTPTPTATPTPTPTPIPWTLEGAIEKLPEVYTEAVTPQTVEQYTQLLSAMPEEARWWITGMGWGLEDLELDANEVALLELLIEKNVPTAMSILTSPDIIDGVTWSEVTWAQGYEVESLAALLQDDIDELLTQGLLSDEGLAGINRLIEMAAANFEVAKGLYLIDNFGYPDQSLFWYAVPSYNTQLTMLGYLVQQGISDGYEIVAVSAGLAYGPMLTIYEDNLWSFVETYVEETISFYVGTDTLLRDRFEAPWQISDYPLEASVALVWGGPGSLYPGQITDWPGARRLAPSSILTIAQKRRLNESDWDWMMVSLPNMVEMREMMTSLLSTRGLGASEGLPDAAKFINDYIQPGCIGCPRMDYQEFDWGPQGRIITVEGRPIVPGSIGNMNWEWEQFKETGKFYGHSGDGYIVGYLQHSVGISAFQPRPIRHSIAPHVNAYYSSSEDKWYTTETYDRWPEVVRFGVNAIPFDQWHITQVFDVVYTSDLPKQIWLDGVPAGYIWRSPTEQYW
jgi:hypothetical protein